MKKKAQTRCPHGRKRSMCFDCLGVWGLASSMLQHARERAKRGHLPVDISKEDVALLLSATQGLCPVLAIPFVFHQKKISDATPTLDRYKPEKGYVKGNVAVISFLANSIRRNATPAQIQKVADYAKEVESK